MTTSRKDAYIKRIIEETNARGRLTARDASSILGISVDCARLYCRLAAKQGNLIRHANSGPFRDQQSLDALLVERMAKPHYQQPPKGNVIAEECRQSGAMQRVLSVYGVKS
ncbi:DUF977 family protein [Yokenella regensburgei]|uniref:DUF977 family protein n=1 Tax=Yokenella regensburgei TaxID=158877 RepID=UPI003ED9774C